MAEGDGRRYGEHLAAIRAILGKDEIVLTPDNLVNLLAYLQSSQSFQSHAVKAMASIASGEADWNAVDRMITDAELSDRILKRLISRLSGLNVSE